MSKAENLFDLYFQLENNGQKTDALKELSNIFGVTPISFKINYLGNRYIPLKLDERLVDKGIEYLQRQINLNNK